MKKLNYKLLDASCLVASFIMFSASQSYAFVGEIFTIDDLDYTVRTESGTLRTVSVSSTDSATSGDITIPSLVKNNGITYSVISIDDGAFDYCDSLTSIIIPNGVTSIGDAAFSGCDSLVSVTIPDSVISIGENAFSGCERLSSVMIPDNVTFIGDCAFISCGLTSVIIPDSVTFMGDAVFAGCIYLKSVTIGNGVTTIGQQAFDGCDSLTSVTIPNSVTSIGSAAFFECDSLVSVTIPDSVVSMDNAFSYCDGLINVTIPDSVISMDCAFMGCSNLKNVMIGMKVTSMEDAFNSCISLIEISVNTENPAYCSIGGVLFNKSRTTLIQYPAGKKEKSYAIPDGVTSIEWLAFNMCKLKSISIPASVNSIGKLAFEACEDLINVYYHGNVPNAERMPYTARGIYSLTSEVLTSYYPEGNASWIAEIEKNDGQWQERKTATWNPPPQTDTKISYSYQKGIMTLAFTGTLQESNDALNWIPVPNVQDSYSVDTTKGKK